TAGLQLFQSGKGKVCNAAYRSSTVNCGRKCPGCPRDRWNYPGNISPACPWWTAKSAGYFASNQRPRQNRVQLCACLCAKGILAGATFPTHFCPGADGLEGAECARVQSGSFACRTTAARKGRTAAQIAP